MTAARLAALGLAALALAPQAHARADAPRLSAPEDLRAFLLRADELKPDPAKGYPRTPSFAWRPVPRTLRYEFQLSTSDTFRENGIVYSNKQLKTPTLSVPLALPWITGKAPGFALHARVRAVTQVGTTPWTEYGFNMRWRTLPGPLSSFPGLLRWEEVEGATSYQVWLLDAKTRTAPNGKVISTTTNVADERDYYTFHTDAKWTSTLRWRVRAVRVVYGTRANSLPAVSYGPWSGIYTAVNTPFATGPLTPIATVSDLITDSSESGPGHGLMPAFVFSGNTTLEGETVPYYRVYAFTDSDCVNIVFRGSVVGSPAFAPRTSGVLRLPSSLSGTKSVRYLEDGAASGAAELANDNATITPNEAEKPVSATPEPAESSGEDTSGPEEGEEKPEKPETPSEAGSATGSQPSVDTSLPAAETVPVPPVDLWDTRWPQGGYYWTVVGVRTAQAEAVETTLEVGAAVGATTITLANATGLLPGYKLELGPAPPEVVTIKSIDGDTVTLEKALTGPHLSGEQVKLSSDTIFYQDAELPQDVCDAGRVLRFGKVSRPPVAMLPDGAEPFVSGLSTTGRLVSATRTKALFYGPPVAAWKPAAGAHAYELQWSDKSGDDFEPAATPILTYSTSAVLPLKPGTWYYRVRGLNLSMPKGAQRLSWSNTVEVVVAKPRFTIVKK
jgi:hypothetical protein